MKRKSMIILAGAMVCVFLTGCQKTGETTPVADREETVTETSETATETVKESDAAKTEAETETEQAAAADPDYEALYAPVFAEVLEVLENGYDYDEEYQYASNGLMEKVMYPGDGDLMETVGYVMTDVSRDGVPDLLIGCDEDYGEVGPQSMIFNVFTIKEEKPYPVFEGWARSSYNWMGEDHFYYQGSGGAAITLFGENHLCKDGTEIVWDDFYFTDEKEDGKIGFYHNTTGVFDVKEAEEVQMSDDDFYGLMENYENRCKLLSWTPIGTLQGKYGTAGDTEPKTDPLEKELPDEWLFLNGAILSIEPDGTFGLYDDSYTWIFSGTWEANPGKDQVGVKLFSEVGDAGNRPVAEGTLHKDGTGYLVLDLEFEGGLTEFTDGTVALSKKQ